MTIKLSSKGIKQTIVYTDLYFSINSSKYLHHNGYFTYPVIYSEYGHHKL